MTITQKQHSSSRPRSSRILVLVTSLLSAASLAACARDTAQMPTPVIALALSANEPRPALDPTTATSITRFAANADSPGKGVVELVVAAGLPVTVDLTPMRGKQVEESHPEQTAAHNVAGLLRRIGAARSSVPGNDELGTLSTAARNAPTGATIYLIGSGLSTLDPLDFRSIGWGVDPKALAADLARRDLLPKLATHPVVFVGLGDTRAPQAQLTNPIRVRLAKVWTDICYAAGAASCSVASGDLPDAPPATTVPTPDVPVPDFPSLVGGIGPTACRASVTLTAAQVPFEPDSAELSTEARQVF